MLYTVLLAMLDIWVVCGFADRIQLKLAELSVYNHGFEHYVAHNFNEGTALLAPAFGAIGGIALGKKLKSTGMILII